MSDTPNEELPDWLSKTAPEDTPTPAPAFSLAAPPEAIAADPATITAQTERLAKAEPAPLEIAAVADVLIKFKRFWQANSGTSNEQEAALECAKYLVGMVKYAGQS